VRQVGNQSRLYYDARSANHQDGLHNFITKFFSWFVKKTHHTTIINVFDKSVIYGQETLRHKQCDRVRGRWKDNTLETKEMLRDGVEGCM